MGSGFFFNPAHSLEISRTTPSTSFKVSTPLAEEPTKVKAVGVRSLEEEDPDDSDCATEPKRGAPFKGPVRDQESERLIKEKRSVFRMFKNFYGKGLYI